MDYIYIYIYIYIYTWTIYTWTICYGLCVMDSILWTIYDGLYIYIYIYMMDYKYIYIYIYILSASWKLPGRFFYGFRSRHHPTFSYGFRRWFLYGFRRRRKHFVWFPSLFCCLWFPSRQETFFMVSVAESFLLFPSRQVTFVCFFIAAGNILSAASNVLLDPGK